VPTPRPRPPKSLTGDEVDRIRRAVNPKRVVGLGLGFVSTEQLDDRTVVRPPAELVRQISAHSYRGLGPLYVATPELLADAG
jgi:hypothetical protein